MNNPQIVLHGTVRPDGTLELDEKVALPAGRVQVTVQSVAVVPPDDSFWQRMQAIWDGQKARGHVPRSEEEVEAQRRALREESEEELRELERIHRECQASRRAEGQGGDASP